jgi:hypothetical protein
MRTALDFAGDALQAVKERAQRERKTLGEMISELAHKLELSIDVKSPKFSPPGCCRCGGRIDREG